MPGEPGAVIVTGRSWRSQTVVSTGPVVVVRYVSAAPVSSGREVLLVRPTEGVEVGCAADRATVDGGHAGPLEQARVALGLGDPAGAVDERVRVDGVAGVEDVEMTRLGVGVVGVGRVVLEADQRIDILAGAGC